MKEGRISARKAGLLWGLSMKRSTLQVKLNRRVTFDRRIEVPSPSFFFKKMKKKKSFADRLIQLANRGFGMSTDAFLKSVKKFLHKEVRIIPFNSRPCSPPSGYWASCPDTGQHRSSAKILISRWKQRQKS